MGKKKEKYRGHENPDLHAATIARGLSGAAGSHDSRPKRERTRQAAEKRAIRDAE